MGEMRNVYKILVTIAEGKTTCRKPRCRQMNNIKMHLTIIGCVKMYTGFMWVRAGSVKTAMNLSVL
jgi:hypothetical protein